MTGLRDSSRRTGTEHVGSQTLREKLEAPAVIRGILASAAHLVDLLDERVLLQDDEMVAAGTELRRQLEALDAIRTGA